MKRQRPPSPLSASSSHIHKKPKTLPSGSQETPPDDGGEWTKVEKRKTKKAKKTEANFDVCLAGFLLVNTLKISQKNPPRFMYVNSDIVKRREAVKIDVGTLSTLVSLNTLHKMHRTYENWFSI